MIQFKIPAILRQKKWIAGGVRVFVYDKIERVQSLKRRPVNATTGCKSETIGRICLVTNISAWKKSAVMPGKRRIYLWFIP